MSSGIPYTNKFSFQVYIFIFKFKYTKNIFYIFSYINYSISISRKSISKIYLKNKHIVIQKPDKGNSIVIVDRDKHIEKMENFLSDQSKFQKTALKDDNFLNFITIQEKRIDKIYKKLVDSNSMSEETRNHLNPVGTRPGMFGSCKVHKKYVDGCPPFRPILPSLQTPTPILV